MALYRNNSLFYRPEGFGVGEITFDLITNEAHSMSNTLTAHRVEDGSVISDHIKNDLRNGSLSGLVTNFSIQNPTTFLGVGATLETGLANRALTAYDAFKLLWLSKSLVTIVTQLEVYENVAIKSIDTSKDDATDALGFNVTFREFPVVKLKQVEIEASVNPKNMDTLLNRQAAILADQGTQTGV